MAPSALTAASTVLVLAAVRMRPLVEEVVQVHGLVQELVQLLVQERVALWLSAALVPSAFASASRPWCGALRNARPGKNHHEQLRRCPHAVLSRRRENPRLRRRQFGVGLDAVAASQRC